MVYDGWKNGFLGDPCCLVYLWNYGHFFEVVFDCKLLHFFDVYVEDMF